MPKRYNSSKPSKGDDEFASFLVTRFAPLFWPEGWSCEEVSASKSSNPNLLGSVIELWVTEFFSTASTGPTFCATRGVCNLRVIFTNPEGDELPKLGVSIQEFTLIDGPQSNLDELQEPKLEYIIFATRIFLCRCLYKSPFCHWQVVVEVKTSLCSQPTKSQSVWLKPILQQFFSYILLQYYNQLSPTLVSFLDFNSFLILFNLSQVDSNQSIHSPHDKLSYKHQ